MELFTLANIYMKISFQASSSKCEFFAMPSQGEMHRCPGCLTKLYCGDKCKEEDWEKVHKLVCRESGKESRKRKGGFQAKKEVGMKTVDSFIKYIKNMDIMS